ncbi:MAG: hypothetical protein NTX50_05495 [Candidatus Sumerlaeota bacterium]|nr:hypothetical protein [Candidatus Sumerlaeota bacterium]
MRKWACLLMMGFGATSIGVDAGARDYHFDGKISRETLEAYLSRAVTEAEWLHGKGDPDENIRMLKNIGAKFVGRSVYMWGAETDLPGRVTTGGPLAKKIHAADPDIILQAAIFEIITRRVNELPVPERVLTEFGQPIEKRNFRYDDMIYPDGKFKDHWRKDSSVPDMSRTETKMWFYHVAASYIDIGIEAIHFGQVELMDRRDKDHTHWRDMIERVRRYAATYARRHLILCDAHVPSGGIVHDGKTMLDFHSFPLRIAPVIEKPEQGVLKVGFLDSLYGRSKGGLTPSGWTCDHLPYIVELDNFGKSGREGKNIPGCWIWGYDEIGWFAHQSESYRNDWLRYAWKWVRENDPNGFLQMPGDRCLATPVNGKQMWYWANTASKAASEGFNQEETIKAIWAADK